MFMPLAQLLANAAAGPAALAGLALPTVLLGWAGNSLMVPRALATRDRVWLTGSLWGATLGGWAVALSVYRGGHLQGGAFWPLTAAYVAWLGAVGWRDARARGARGMPGDAFRDVLLGLGRPAGSEPAAAAAAAAS